MKFNQSRFQSIVYRLRKATVSVSIFSLILVVSFLLGSEPDESFIVIYLAGVFGFPIVYILWLMLFNSWKNKVDEYSIEFTEDGIRYINMGVIDFLPWSEFKEYKISGKFDRVLKIDGENTEIKFDLGVFNSLQQKGIISNLSATC